MDRYCELVLSFLKANVVPLAQGRDKSHKWIPVMAMVSLRLRTDMRRAGLDLLVRYWVIRRSLTRTSSHLMDGP